MLAQADACQEGEGKEEDVEKGAFDYEFCEHVDVGKYDC